MRYKVEVISNGDITREFYFKNLSQPKQAARKTVEMLPSRYSSYMMLIGNEYGEIWSMIANRTVDGMKIRKHRQYSTIMSKDDIDMLFNGNLKIYTGVVA